MKEAKTPTLPTQIIKIQGNDLEFQMDPKQHPMIVSQGHTYNSLQKVLEAYPALSDKNNLAALAKVINFLSQGTSYRFIEDISAFKEAYINRIEFEQNSFDYMPMRLIDHGVFNINGMHAPSISNDELVFFVQDDHTGVPYRVTCSYPITGTSKASYHLLPYAE